MNQALIKWIPILTLMSTLPGCKNSSSNPTDAQTTNTVDTDNSHSKSNKDDDQTRQNAEAKIGGKTEVPANSKSEAKPKLPLNDIWCQKEPASEVKLTMDSVISRYKLKGSCEQIYAEVAKMSELDLTSQGITNLEPLSGLKYLERFYAPENMIVDITPLSNLSSLVVLDLNNNKIENIAPLKSLTTLTAVNLGNNEIADLSAISSLKKLISLVLIDNRISTVAHLSGMKKLHVLALAGNDFTDIAELKNLAALSSLDLTEADRSKFTDCPKDTANAALNKFCGLTAK